MRALRKRPRPDTLKTQQRKMTNNVGRLVYLTLVIVLVVGLINFLFGDLVFLRADGLVISNKASVAATYVAHVESVDVDVGQTVKKGDVLLSLRSTEMLERFAELSANRARLAARVVEFKVRAETSKRLMPLAKRREHETDRVLGVFDNLSNRKLVTTARYDQALLARIEAQQEFIKLSTESTALDDELDAIQAAQADAEAALADLRAHYADGVVRAPTDGAVGVDVPSQGDVYRPGEAIMSVYSGRPYVLAYLPRRYLFPIEPGLRVNISNGRFSAEGEIEKILPLTKETPKEFQNSFRPTDRNQLARIRIVDTPPFPLHEKVRITTAGFPY